MSEPKRISEERRGGGPKLRQLHFQVYRGMQTDVSGAASSVLNKVMSIAGTTRNEVGIERPVFCV